MMCFLQRNMEVKLVPWDYDFTQEAYDGLFISNGPGDPALAHVTVGHIRQVSSYPCCLMLVEVVYVIRYFIVVVCIRAFKCGLLSCFALVSYHPTKPAT